MQIVLRRFGQLRGHAGSSTPSCDASQSTTMTASSASPSSAAFLESSSTSPFSKSRSSPFSPPPFASRTLPGSVAVLAVDCRCPSGPAPSRRILSASMGLSSSASGDAARSVRGGTVE